MTKLVTNKCPCCGTRGLNPKKIKDMCENCLETSFDQWRRKVVSLEKENAELKKEISVLLSCANCPENKGGYICEKEYNDKCLAQKIEYIKELEEENVELKEQIDQLSNDNHVLKTSFITQQEQIKKIKKMWKL